jgi:hypothetical protein
MNAEKGMDADFQIRSICVIRVPQKKGTQMNAEKGMDADF